jgi:5-oxoprolinase (ATP-hydrolysing)
VIKAFKVVEGGVFKEKELEDLLMAPSKIPGVSGTRCLQDNVSDIKAQAAANHRGSQLIHSLIADYGLDVVQFYSKSPGVFQCALFCSSNSFKVEETIRAAELAVRDMLKKIFRSTDGKPLEGVDYMDDGTAIQLKVTIDETTGGAIFDFAGTGPEVYGMCSPVPGGCWQTKRASLIWK